jgi:hypothetical protein
MAKFKVLHAFAILLILIATEAQAHGIGGREVAAPAWSAACMTDQGPSVCGEPMWVYGTIGDQAGKETALSPELNAPHRNGGDRPHVDWPANMILG